MPNLEAPDGTSTGILSGTAYLAEPLPLAETATAKPLLTIAIPTYNRSRELSLLLTCLAPQLTDHPEVELFISDNCSQDDTQAVVRTFIDRGLTVRYVRQAENVGSDRNFVTCFECAHGTFFWMCGDDDVILPGALEKVLAHLKTGQPLDLMYVTGYGFRQDFAAERREDRLHRTLHTFTDPREFAKVVNVTFTFISAMVVNRDRLIEIPHEEPSALIGTNLIQLGWCLPLLLHHRRSLVLWERSLAGKQGNAGGYAIGRVFGMGLRTAVERLLPGRQDIQSCILNPTVRRWLPSALYAVRSEKNEKLGLDAAEQQLSQAYGRNFRYWLFAYPVLRLPLFAAKLWFKAGLAANMAIYILSVPGFWRRQT